MLACFNVSKRYGAIEVLHDCSLSVSPGSCVLVRGPSGGGKSTLLRILALLEPANAGRVVHGGEEFHFLPAKGRPLRASAPFPFLTLVFQQLFLWPHMTMRENIAIVLSGDRHASLTADATDLLARFEVEQTLDRKPHECSLGQRQRVAIARAILTPTSFLLLDEPSSALDKASKVTVIEELAKAKAGGRGLLVVTHDERDFDELADACYELENGVLNAAH